MEDQSIYNKENNSTDVEFINGCIREVCLKGDSLSKYQKIIEKKYGPDFYPKCERFVEELRHSVERKKFTDSSMISLTYLAKEIHLTDETIDAGVKYFNAKFEAERKAAAEEETKRKAEEKARRDAEEAERQRQQRIAEEKRKEEAKRKAEREAEQTMWQQCLASHTKESIQQYLNRYPSGIFAARAYDEIGQIEEYEKRLRDEEMKKTEEEAKEKRRLQMVETNRAPVKAMSVALVIISILEIVVLRWWSVLPLIINAILGIITQQNCKDGEFHYKKLLRFGGILEFACFLEALFGEGWSLLLIPITVIIEWIILGLVDPDDD